MPMEYEVVRYLTRTHRGALLSHSPTDDSLSFIQSCKRSSFSSSLSSSYKRTQYLAWSSPAGSNAAGSIMAARKRGFFFSLLWSAGIEKPCVSSELVCVKSLSLPGNDSNLNNGPYLMNNANSLFLFLANSSPACLFAHMLGTTAEYVH